MINKMKARTGGYKNGVANSAKYLLKTDPKGDSIDSSIERLEGESDQAYANRIEKIFEGARVPNQKNLYQHNALAFHPSDGEKLTDAQMIDIAKEVYLKNGLGKNRHYLFVVERNTEHPHVHALLHLTDLDINRVNNKFVKYNPILEKIENKYGLYNQHRMPTPENTAPSNDQKSEKDLKKDFKTDLKSILENALTASEFLILVDRAGFDITHNGNTAYSLTKDDQMFKASDLGMSYKTLKGHLGDDPQFTATLASLHKEKPGNDGLGGISFAMHVTQSDLDQYETKKRNSNRVLETKFDTRDGHDFYFKDSNKKAFKYDPLRRSVEFNTSSPAAVKAGLQKLTEKGKPDTIMIEGHDAFRREVWLQFHMMNLDKKGYSFAGFSPTSSDKARLEKMKLENPAFKRTEGKKIADKSPKNLPNHAEKQKKTSHVELESFTKFKISDTELTPETGAENAGQNSGAAAVIGGILTAALEIFTERDIKGEINEQLSQMRVLDQLIKNKQSHSEDEEHQTKRRKLQKPRPQ